MVTKTTAGYYGGSSTVHAILGPGKGHERYRLACYPGRELEAVPATHGEKVTCPSCLHVVSHLVMVRVG